MNKLLSALVLAFLSAAPVQAQTVVKVYTTPKLPPREALERMKLKLAWHQRVQVDGNRDGIASLQLIPGTQPQIVVQTYHGLVYLYDADSGDLIWKTQVGVPYWTSQPAAFNSRSIFVTRRSVLYVLNRADGFQRVFTFNSKLKEYDFGHDVLFTPNAAPAADEDFLYMPMGNRVHAIFIPDFERFERIKREQEAIKRGTLIIDPLKRQKLTVQDEETLATANSPQPDFYWGHLFAGQFTTSVPLIHRENIGILTTDGAMTILNRFERVKSIAPFEFKMTGNTLAAAGQHQYVAYVGSDDFNLYAINLKSGDLDWRYIAGAPILNPPRVNDRDVFIATDRLGMRRIDRLSGRAVWTNTDATRFLAANHQFVYATDHVGQFFVLDGRRGGTLAKLDLSGWKIRYANEWTDRIYLAANDGQLMCLRHSELTKPLFMKLADAFLPKAAPQPKEEKKDPDAMARAAKPGRVAPPAPRLEVAPALARRLRVER